MQLVEKHIVKQGSEYYKVLDNAAFMAKNLYNATLYEIRQHFFQTGQFLNYNKLQKQFQGLRQPDYYALPTKVSQQVMKSVNDSFSSFFNANKSYKKNPSKFTGRPRIPKYKDKKDGRFMLKYTYQAISKSFLERYGKIKLSGLDVCIGTRLKYEDICEVRVVKKTNSYAIEIVYTSPDAEQLGDNGMYAAIDLGVSNFATLTSNKKGFEPIVIDGREAKSYNRYYNKKTAKLKSILATRNGKRTSHEVKRITEKRNNKMSDFIHKASRLIVNHLVSEGINNLIVGHNKNWKQDANLGHMNNQNFVELPYDKFISALSYKCQMSGIAFKKTEESHTSKCSFLDLEEICHHDKYFGRRIKRGLFRSGSGRLINADVNGSYNILRKCMPEAFADGVVGVIVHPRIIKIRN